MRFLIPGLAVLTLLVVLFLLIDPPDRVEMPGPVPENGLDPDRATISEIRRDAERLSVSPVASDEAMEETEKAGETDLDPMESPGWRVLGKVIDEEGNPVPDAKVCIQYLLRHEITGPAELAFTNGWGNYSLGIRPRREWPRMPRRRISFPDR